MKTEIFQFRFQLFPHIKQVEPSWANDWASSSACAAYGFIFQDTEYANTSHMHETCCKWREWGWGEGRLGLLSEGI